jgi:lysophospholipase L1-like esterase
MFSTVVNIESSNSPILYQDGIMTLGSCFSENIGRKLQNAFFEVDINPFGVLFNPMSVANSIQLLLDNKHFTENDLFQQATLYYSFSHSTLFSGNNPDEVLTRINQRIETAVENLQKSRFLLITFGTAWVYEHEGEVVSNCHKLPSATFQRRRLSVDEIVSNYQQLIQTLKARFPELQIVFTVSPIRHWKDGAHENNLSKSILHLAVEELQQLFTNVSYFPAYEIQLDELRDYRFYSSDMFHPSEVAVDYIWKRFGEVYFSANTQKLLVRLEKLAMQMNHRSIHPKSDEHQHFLKQLEQQKLDLIREFPFLKGRV